MYGLRPLALLLAFAAPACGGQPSSGGTGGSGSGAPPCTNSLSPGADDQSAAQGALVDAKSGDVVCLAAGRYVFTAELSLAVTGVTLRGVDGTVLDFSGQKGGASAISVTADGALLDTLRVEDPAGDGVRATAVNGITMRGIQVVWTKGPRVTNGGHGLYPVQSTRVLVEDCYVSGASDSGIHMGQSRQIVVRRSEVTQNVAGIEIENSTDAEVYGNHAHDNVGGILVFALPGFPMQASARANVHDNLSENNNTTPFAPTGNLVNLVPSGTGMLVLASDDNELANNTVQGNDSVGISILSWALAQMPANDPRYDQIPDGNSVHDNTLANNGAAPRGKAALLAALIGAKTIPELSWDGNRDPKQSARDPAFTNCFMNNGSADFIDFDIKALGKNASRDVTPYTCSHPSLPAIDPTGFPGE